MHAPIASNSTVPQSTPSSQPQSQQQNLFGKHRFAMITQPLRLNVDNSTLLGHTTASGGKNAFVCNGDGPKDENGRIEDRGANPYELLSAFEERE
jgi:hypothetical protein